MKYLTNYVPQGTGGMSAGYVVVEDNGVLKAQKLSFDGTTPKFDGVAEEITGVGIFETGLDEPAYNGSGTGGSAKYYKCASVDTTAKKWSGYELVSQDGVYVVSDVETTGLTYAGFTPLVNTMYNEDATFIISNLFSKSETLEGCVFAANMQSNVVVYNGETITLDGMNLVSAPGYTDGTKALNASDCEIDFDGKSLLANNEVSFAVSFYYPAPNDTSSIKIFELRDLEDDGSGAGEVRISGGWHNGYTSSLSASLGATVSPPAQEYGWHHIVLTSNNKIVKGYLDGVQYGSSNDNGYGVPSDYEKIYMRTAFYGNVMYIKDVQVYNRVLDEADVIDLYTKAKLPIA